MKGRTIHTLCMLVMLLTGLAQAKESPEDAPHHSVLFISSYHPGFPTFFEHVEGLRSVLKSPAVRLDIEFMDTKRFEQAALEHIFYLHLLNKLAQLPTYDLIISADDAATHFVVAHQQDLFANIPVVFFGVNDLAFARSFNHDPLKTGVTENIAFMETVALIRQLFGHHELVIITDSTATASADTQRFQQEIKNAGISNYRTLSLAEFSFGELLQQVQQIQAPSSILLISMFRDRDGQALDFERSLREVRLAAQVPIFHLWHHGMGQGVIGGKLLSHRTQAKLAASMAQKILAGTSPADIPVLENPPTEYHFDYQEMQRFGLDFKDMPAGSQFINTPNPLYERYRNYIIAIEILLAVLVVALLMLVTRMFSRRNFERRIMAINDALEDKVQQRTADLEEAHLHAKSILRQRDIILDNSLVSIVLIHQRRVEWVNQYSETMFGYPQHEIIGQETDLIYQHANDYARVGREAPPILRKGGTYEAECAFRRKDGTVLWGILSGKAINPDDLEEGVLFIIIDITARKLAEERLKALNIRLETQATTDHLTGLCNRRRATENILREIQQADRYRNLFSVILLDVDHFKHLNDTHGHSTGDDVLKGIARVLKETCRQVDTTARWGGEEFLILCPFTPPAEAEKLAELLRARLEKQDFGPPCRVTASFGVAAWRSGLDLEGLIREADNALYAAKETRNCVKAAGGQDTARSGAS